jgi:endonuclease/exonuclease/phosphatase family metal-dependent hydrolase
MTEPLRVLTLNIWNRLGPWDQRLALIREGLAALSPDVVGLQEVLHMASLGSSQAEAIIEGTGYHLAHAPAGDLGHGLTLGNAVLSRWPILEQQGFALPVADGQAGRGLLYTAIDTPAGRLPFFVTHLDWEFHFGIWRQRQVVEIARHIAALAPPGGTALPPVLCGDFNAEPDSDEIRFLLGLTALEGKTVYLADCFRVAGDGSPGHTFCRRNAYAGPLREPDRRIDYVFVRGPDKQGRGEPLSARVVLDQPDGSGAFASDHFGVLAEISTA